MLSFCRTPSTGKCKIVQLRSWLESDTNPHRNVGQRAYTKAVWWIIRICARFCSATKPNAVQGYCNYIYCFYSVICSGFCATDAPVEWKWNTRYLFASSFLGQLNKRVDEVELAFGSITITQIGDMPMLVRSLVLLQGWWIVVLMTIISESIDSNIVTAIHFLISTNNVLIIKSTAFCNSIQAYHLYKQ